MAVKLKGKLRVSFRPDEGSLVEVRTDEEGHKGVWYIATVLGMESPHRAHVEYCSLVSDEDSSEPLREHVDVEFIRPQPPREKTAESFEVGHLVDGYYQDGWWTGVITGVLFGGLSFVVTFQDPPDQQVFGSSKLRFHRRWVNGKWEKPGKQDTRSLVFGAGKEVEVCRGNHFVPAVVMEERGNGIYVVDYYDYEKRRETVVSNVIRPCPPPLKDQVFRLGDTVEASLASGWWRGTITKLKPDSSFNVLLESGNRQKRFSHAELRHHLEWDQGNWDVSRDKTHLSNEPLGGDGASPLHQTHSRKRKEVHEEDVPISALKEVAMETPSESVVTLQNIKRRRGRPRKISAIPPKETIVDTLVNAEQSAMEKGPEQSAVASEQIMEESLPFVKRNILWSTLESLEPLRKWPQKPHFRPLEKYDERCREGRAIGFVADFCNIVESSSKLEFLNEVKRCDNKVLQVLAELEENGFDVKVVRDRMGVAVRENREKLQKEYQVINGEVAKQNMEIVELDKKVEELKVQMKTVQDEKEAKSRQIASLQLKLEELRKGIMERLLH